MKYKDIYGDIPNEIAKQVEKEAAARARYRVQEDYNREMIAEIAYKTGHENLASTCFVEVDVTSSESLRVYVYTDNDMIDGIYRSKSSFHQSGGKWESISGHYGMSRYEFWDRKESGEEGQKGRGIVDTEWLTDNFWHGVYYATNGWPRSDAEFLSVYLYHDISAHSVTDSYHQRYVRSGRFQKYLAEEVAAML